MADSPELAARPPVPATEDVGVLDRTIGTTFTAATNLKGAVAGAAWTLLLDSLELDRVLCVGRPSAPTLATLARLAREVVVVDAAGRGRRAPAGADPENVLLTDAGSLPANAPPFSLAVVGAGARPDGPAAAQIAAAAAVFHEDLPGDMRRDARRVVLTPSRGEPDGAAPAGDAQLVAFLRSVTASPVTGRSGLRRLVKRIVSRRPAGMREAALAGSTEGPPAYVREIAESAGMDIGAMRCVLTAPADYVSRKAVLFLFDADGERPRHIVKLTRDPAHNARLENEWRALVALRDAGVGDAETVPQPDFAGHHAGFSLVGESAVEGGAFRKATSFAADCPLAVGARDWILDMGARTAHAQRRHGEVLVALRDLHERFLGLYDLAEPHRRLLADQLDRLQATAPLPLIFQHGDPGTWNLMATPAGRPVFLDWEAFEPRGLPLFDLFYFLRSYTIGAARAAGTWPALEGLTKHWLSPSPHNELLVASAHAQCEQLGIPREQVEPLFHLTWMHRALKEAARLPRGKEQQGHYVSLLRLGLEERESPGLKRLFA